MCVRSVLKVLTDFSLNPLKPPSANSVSITVTAQAYLLYCALHFSSQDGSGPTIPVVA